jgi:acetyl esterase/lipase
MTSFAALAALAALTATATPAREQPSQRDQARAFADAVNRQLVYHVRGEDKVRVRRDIVYRGDPEARADVYEPEGSAKGARAPIVVFIHGGVGADIPVRPKDWGIYQGWGRLMAASGFVAVAFNHRLGFPEPFMTEAADDVETLLAYVRRHAAEFGADPDRICLASYSAGGPLLSAYIREPRPYVRCLAAFYSMLDIRDSEIHRRFMKPEQLAMFSPAAQVEEHPGAAPPMFVMRAGHDRIPGLNTWMEKFLDVAIRKNAPLTLMIHPTGVHGFENTNDDDRSREILKAAIEFMRTHFETPPGTR